MIESKVLTVKQAMRACGLGRTKFYELLNSGHIKAKKIGKKTIITESSIGRFIKNLPDYCEDSREMTAEKWIRLTPEERKNILRPSPNISIDITWSTKTDRAKVVFSPDFRRSNKVLRQDMLKDALFVLEKKYNSLLAKKAV